MKKRDFEAVGDALRLIREKTVCNDEAFSTTVGIFMGQLMMRDKRFDTEKFRAYVYSERPTIKYLLPR